MSWGVGLQRTEGLLARLLPLTELKRFGYSLLEAVGGADAIRIAKNRTGPVHLLLTDVVMPGMSGPGVAKEIVSLHPEVKVLFVSGYTNDAITRHGILQERVHFLHKPFAKIALACKVREVLDSPVPDLARVVAHTLEKTQ